MIMINDHHRNHDEAAYFWTTFGWLQFCLVQFNQENNQEKQMASSATEARKSFKKLEAFEKV